MNPETDTVAAIDCGTNSIRLLIAERVDGRLRDLHREMRIVRLGEGVDATGRFAVEALARTEAALVDYAVLLGEHSVRKLRMVATSATRDAATRDEFFAMTATILGAVVPGAVAEVITGTEEAQLSFAGAVGELDSAAAPFVVVDLGGGSTEVVLGDGDGVQASYSADIGCVRMTERCLHSDPPTAAEVAAAPIGARAPRAIGPRSATRRRPVRGPPPPPHPAAASSSASARRRLLSEGATQVGSDAEYTPRRLRRFRRPPGPPARCGGAGRAVD